MKTKPPIFKLSRREMKTVFAAMGDAIRDREEFANAYRPKYSKPDKQALSIICRTERQIANYRKMQKRIRDHFEAVSPLR